MPPEYKRSDWQRYYTVALRKLPAVLVISFGAALIALLITRSVGPRYEVHFSYLVSLSVREAATDFRFDGYYALQATDLFAATLANWLTTPDVIVAAHRAAGLVLPTEDPVALTRLVVAQKPASQLVHVTVRGDNAAETQELAQGLLTAVNRNVTLYHDKGIPALTFRVVATEPWTGVREPATLVIAAAAFVAAGILSVNAILLIASLKQTVPPLAAKE